MAVKEKLENRIRDYIEKKNLPELLKMKRDFKVEFLAQGEYNKNYTVSDGLKKFVFRSNTSSQLGLEDQIGYEYGALKVLESSGVTPKVYFVDGSKELLEHGVLVMEYLVGRPLDYGTDLEKAATIFGKIHSIETKSIYESFIVETDILSDRIEEAENWLQSYMESPEVDISLKRFFESFLNWAKKNEYRQIYFRNDPWHVVNNTEVNSHNFIIGKDNSYLIDWEKPVISDPCQDITQFIAETTTLWKSDHSLSPEEKERFFKSYASNLESGDRDIRDRVEIYSPYLYLRAFSWCAHAWLEYRNPEKDIVNMDTKLKLDEYLDLDFMKKVLGPLCDFL